MLLRGCSVMAGAAACASGRLSAATKRLSANRAVRGIFEKSRSIISPLQGRKNMATSLAVSAELQFLFEEIGSRRFSVGATPWLLLTAFLSSSLTWEIDGGDDGSFIR